jgi:FKBP-type peptidyl-prolyl cis-trans isomerase
MIRVLLTICLMLCPFSVLATNSGDNQTASSQTANPADHNKLVGQAFLAKNMSNPGVVTLPSGLQYKIIKPGQGGRPLATDTVSVHYAGKLINGTEFDSSYKRGEPAQFRLDQVISGWTEALQRMNKGAVWELYIPASLAYGEQGMPPTIGPNETLIFKVELLDILKQ